MTKTMVESDRLYPPSSLTTLRSTTGLLGGPELGCSSRLGHGHQHAHARLQNDFEHDLLNEAASFNHRLLSATDDAVTFRTKGDATATLHALDFLHRFLQRVLPSGFVKLRHYGLLARAAATTGTRLNDRVLLSRAWPRSRPRQCTHHRSGPRWGASRTGRGRLTVAVRRALVSDGALA
ncbi:MAG: transposase [Myxococcales bacterium]|nr:transposase [Myxococcales bacterium]